jgi:hypothetical protein
MGIGHKEEKKYVHLSQIKFRIPENEVMRTIFECKLDKVTGAPPKGLV